MYARGEPFHRKMIALDKNAGTQYPGILSKRSYGKVLPIKEKGKCELLKDAT